MKIVVLDAATLGADIDLSPLAALGELTVHNTTPEHMISERLADADAVVVNKLKMNEKTLNGAKNLKFIGETATGYDNIDTAYCAARGIAVCNVPAYSSDSVAQLTLAMALSLATHLFAYRDHVAGGAYSAGGVANCLTPVYHEISSLTWGVVGGGGIGRRVADVAKALGCRVLMCRKQPETVFESADIDTLCREADIISLHVPLTEETRGMIDAARIAAMKRGAILINVSRGAVCDEAAVAAAIEDGHLGGLGVDVFTKEPFGTDHPFTRIMGRENVCLTPHMAWGAVEARGRCVNTVASNLRAFLQGERQNRIV
ncbi:MAG: hydroxyacid dehydrogenase [Clostridia bacterium]|nr:hydroxyacid dehydrogenase [Clostridia bacterium]